MPVPQIAGVDHLSLTVRNLGVSEAWYKELFGLVVVRRKSDSRFETVLLKDPGSSMLISLRHHFGAGTARFDETRTGLDHVSFAVSRMEDLNEWKKRLEESHIEHSPISESDSGAVLVFRDPDHIQLEFSFRNQDA
ncbi:MAG: VOC family protein [Actinobacteria bacterium]|nr:VOC family protein [Actinomycetota bacterium]MCL5444755.1 VOC family protein [Actinomycetota bacterium]